MSAEGDPNAEAVVSDGKAKPRNMVPVYMAAIAVVFLVVGFLAGGSMTGAVIGGGAQDAVGSKVAGFINENLAQSGQTASVTSVEDEGSLYLVNISYMGQNIGVYASKDGKYIMLGSVLDMDVPLPEPEYDAGDSAPAETPKSDRPVAELFVMSFCPYGVQAEQAMAPVADLLGDKADIRVRFIASASGTELSSIQSRHGNIEGVEDARQLCIAKNYDTATYWKYLEGINSNCYPIYRNGEAAYDACWKSAATAAGVDVAGIESCMSSEGVALINAESRAADGYGVTGSPTLIINGARYNGGRTPEAFKTAVCNAFNEAPAECGQTLGSGTTTGTPEGGCA